MTLQPFAQTLTHSVADTIGVAQLVCLVDDHYVPGDELNVALHRTCKVDRRNYDGVGEERLGNAVLLELFVGGSVQDERWQVELLFELQTPLFADRCRANDQK